MQKIEYTGIVYAINHGYPEPLIEHTLKKLNDYGIKKDDIEITYTVTIQKIKDIIAFPNFFHLRI